MHSKDGYPKLASEFEKKGIVPYQPPGCVKHGVNGVKLAPFIHIPIEKDMLASSGLIGWNEAQVDIVNTFGAQKWTVPPQDEDQEMLSKEFEVEETQVDQSIFDSDLA